MFLVQDSSSAREERIKQCLAKDASCSTDYAEHRVYWALDATNDVRTVCVANGINLDARLPIRRHSKN